MKDEEKEEKLYKISHDNEKETPHKLAVIIADLIITLIVIVIILIGFFIPSKNNTIRIISLMFISFLICSIGEKISEALDKDNLVNLFYKGYQVIVIIFGFILLTNWTYKFIIDGIYIPVLILLLPFWIMEIVAAYNVFIKKNK